MPAASAPTDDVCAPTAAPIDDVCALFEATVMPFVSARVHEPRLTDSERARLMHAYAGVLDFAAHWRSQSGSDATANGKETAYLAQMTLRDLLPVQEVARWLLCHCDAQQRAQVLREFPRRQRDDAERTTDAVSQDDDNDQRWMDSLQAILAHWAERLAKERLWGRLNIPDGAPLDFFAVFDCWQDYVDMCTADIQEPDERPPIKTAKV
jgi:hypothetical protein